MSAHEAHQTPLVELTKQLASGGITRREFLYRAAALGLSAPAAAALLAACGSGQSSTTSSPTALDTALPDKLELFNWSEYMPPGVLKSFQRKYGVRVVESYYDGNEAMYAKLQASATGYDLVVPDNSTVHIMIKSGLIQPLDMSLIPNFKNVAARFQHPDYDPGKNSPEYSVPYQWGTTGIGHRTDIVTEPITKWADLWNPTYKGQIVMMNDERDTLGVGLMVLGYSFNSTKQAELDQAVKKLIAQKPLVKAYDSMNSKRYLISGTPLVQGWNGYVLQAYDTLGSQKLEYVLPEEGFDLWVGNMAIPVGAPSPYAAHLFLNYLFEPKIAAQIVDYTWYSSPVPAAKPYSNPLIWDFVPSEETMTRAQFIVDVGAFRASYDAAWTEVKSA
jgi:spermidine/putrescine transport system substrate-binding protein